MEEIEIKLHPLELGYLLELLGENLENDKNSPLHSIRNKLRDAAEKLYK
jgi:hypothetical protein